MSRKKKDPLYLILDTNFFLVNQDNRRNVVTDAKDPRTPIQILESFQRGSRGALPDLVVRIPYIVRVELYGINKGPEKGWVADSSAVAQARHVLDFMDKILCAAEPDLVVTFQDKFEHDAMNCLRNNRDDCDEMVLLCCLQTRENYSRNVCLVTHDAHLVARAFMSGIQSINTYHLKYAMRLRNGPDCAVGESYFDCALFDRTNLSLRRIVEQEPIAVIPETTTTDIKDLVLKQDNERKSEATWRILEFFKAVGSSAADLLKMAF